MPWSILPPFILPALPLLSLIHDDRFCSLSIFSPFSADGGSFGILVVDANFCADGSFCLFSICFSLSSDGGGFAILIKEVSTSANYVGNELRAGLGLRLVGNTGGTFVCNVIRNDRGTLKGGNFLSLCGGKLFSDVILVLDATR